MTEEEEMALGVREEVEDKKGKEHPASGLSIADSYRAAFYTVTMRSTALSTYPRHCSSLKVPMELSTSVINSFSFSRTKNMFKHDEDKLDTGSLPKPEKCVSDCRQHR